MRSIEELREMARKANGRPLAEGDDGVILPRGDHLFGGTGVSKRLPLPRTDGDGDPLLDELYLGEEAPVTHERLADGFNV